ncbi:methyltransferase domain-containing protein [Microbacterium hydrocarbonoxydans]|uniref:methyltransferase domain-containing protein n=1 Tax=Microbacterium hydrocarbonoxydans TaxID=273678 RepID=UPI0007BB301A|nr:methyltransferase domain-containing protein [Microbacterium hydrocarbonoxydans]GAT73530.1 methyltransferase type 11 [Microbacterium sp. HM58-2]
MRPDLTVRATGARELMDDPSADRGALARTYLRFGVVNRLVSRPGLLFRRDVRPRARRGGIRILDVGAGGGDLCRFLAARLRRHGLAAEITALDPDERAIEWAQAHDDGAGIRCLCGTTAELVRAGETFDVVFSNHLLHHLSEDERTGLLEDTVRLTAPGGVAVHRDIARSRAAYMLFAAATLPFRRNLLAGSFIRADGLTSIRRSWTVGELRAVAARGWSVRGGIPFRLELRREQGR